jgi:hypothetical protein
MWKDFLCNKFSFKCSKDILENQRLVLTHMSYFIRFSIEYNLKFEIETYNIKFNSFLALFKGNKT